MARGIARLEPFRPSPVGEPCPLSPADCAGGCRLGGVFNVAGDATFPGSTVPCGLSGTFPTESCHDVTFRPGVSSHALLERRRLTYGIGGDGAMVGRMLCLP